MARWLNNQRLHGVPIPPIFVVWSVWSLDSPTVYCFLLTFKLMFNYVFTHPPFSVAWNPLISLCLPFVYLCLLDETEACLVLQSEGQLGPTALKARHSRERDEWKDALRRLGVRCSWAETDKTWRESGWGWYKTTPWWEDHGILVGGFKHVVRNLIVRPDSSLCHNRDNSVLLGSCESKQGQRGKLGHGGMWKIPWIHLSSLGNNITWSPWGNKIRHPLWPICWTG